MLGMVRASECAQEVHNDREGLSGRLPPLNLRSLPRVMDNPRPLRYVSACSKIAFKNPILNFGSV